jgi:hypothetical protein
MPQYQGVWNLAQQAQAQVNQQWVTDPLFDYTALLLQADGAANGAQNNLFLDASSNQFAITRNGNTTQGSFSPFSLQPGAWSAYFDGNGDYITAPNSSNYSFSTNFTVECFAYPTAFSNTPVLFDTRTAAGNTAAMYLYINTSGYLVFIAGGTTITTTTTVALNTWQHFAVVRSSNTVTVYINGISCGSATISTNLADTGLTIGAPIDQRGATTTNKYAGYMSNLRFNNTTAIYTSNFTSSALPFSPASGVTLLTLQSNRFVDNSTAAATLTPNGTTSVQAFSPFAPQYQYTPTVTGGSGYFDGTTDYLSIARNSVFFPAANTDFTFEAWIYPTATPGAQGAIIVGAGEYGLDSDWDLDINSSLQLAMYMNSSPATSYRNTTTTVRLNAWNHVAASRSGTGSNNLKVFVNGVGQSFTTNQTTVGTGNRALTIGGDQNGDEANYTGYISGLRLINGQGIYTADFTPPTAPPTTTSGSVTASNTVLLINFTNAGILDGTMKNDLETVGNAQVSSSVVKYGSGSMSFDGTGDYLQIQPNPAIANNFVFGTGDFTIEAWVYPNSLSAAQDICTYRKDSPAANSDIGFDIYVGASNASNEAAIYNSTTKYAVTGWSLVAGQWQHIAFVRSNGYLLFFVNGLQIGSPVAANVSVNNASTWYMIVGTYTAASRNFNGYIDDLRITKGIARYTRNFTPPQVALPRQ